MRRLLHRLHHDERGMSLVFVGVGFMAFLSASMLAIDVGMFMTARAQAQNSADSGALASAVALAYDDYTNRTSSGPAVQNAIEAARLNQVMGQPVSINSGDVTFLNDPSGNPNWVQVNVFRTSGRGNPVTTLIGSYFGVMSADVMATATAEVANANAAGCAMPFAFPDKWTEKHTPAWDVNDTFSTTSPTNPDIFRTVTNTTYTGFTTTNSGLTVTLSPTVGYAIKANFYIPLDMGGGGGSASYINNIVNCDPSLMHFNDPLTEETGVTASDTANAASQLISQDPGAYWDSTNNQVVSSVHPSPRVVTVPVYDTGYFEAGKKVGNFTQLRISNFVGLFIESVSGTNVVARITPIAGTVDTAGGTAPVGAFPKAVRLVE